MNVRLRACFCPCCGARIDPSLGPVVACVYCDAVLQVEPARISGERSAPSDLLEPEATLVQRSSSHFEMSQLTQLFPGQQGELFKAIELSQERFALLYLRLGGATADIPEQSLVESLEDFGDPGLAANRALEVLCDDESFADRLEVINALFDPGASSVLVYAAGCRDSVWWLSNEEGRAVCVATHHPALERKSLREQRDYFSNNPPLYLAAGDQLLVLSAAYSGRGGGPYAGGLSALQPALNASLADDPLRVVTLAKNAFWSGRAPAARKTYPATPLQLAAVQALPRTLLDLSVSPHLHQFGTERFEIALLADPADWFELLPLHNDRWVLIWASNDGMEVGAQAQDQLRRAVLDVLDRRSHGDNENPRLAGRNALAGLNLRLAVIQFFDQYGRVKYFRSGWKQPITLGPRTGCESECSIQQFDEGGEATVPPGARLFFPGNQDYPGQPHQLGELAKRWPGGKASLLYGALVNHWKLPPASSCLTRLARALVSDLPTSRRREGSHLGMALVTGKKL